MQKIVKFLKNLFKKKLKPMPRPNRVPYDPKTYRR